MSVADQADPTAALAAIRDALAKPIGVAAWELTKLTAAAAALDTLSTACFCANDPVTARRLARWASILHNWPGTRSGSIEPGMPPCFPEAWRRRIVAEAASLDTTRSIETAAKATSPRRQRPRKRRPQNRPPTDRAVQVALTLARNDGNVSRTAAELGISRQAVEKHQKKFRKLLGVATRTAKPKTQPLPRDYRGQETVTGDDD